MKVDLPVSKDVLRERNELPNNAMVDIDKM